jgi:pilus assembly protein Flp/PilA
MTNIMELVRNESGATAFEYALIASLIAVVIIGAVTLVGTNLTDIYTDVANKISDVPQAL